MKAILLVIALVGPALLAAGAAHAAGTAEGFGVTPVELSFTTPDLTRGGSSEGTLRVQNNFHAPTTVKVTTSGDIAQWLKVDVAEFVMPADSARQITVRVAVPASAANGDYAGSLRIRATGTGAPDGSGASTNLELLPAIKVSVGGDQVIRFSVEKVRVPDVLPRTPVTLRIDLLNRGNVRAVPGIDLTILDEDGNVALHENLVGEAIEPGAQATEVLKTTGTLPDGSYTAKGVLDHPVSDAALLPVTFEVSPNVGAPPPPQGSMTSLTHEMVIPTVQLATFTAHFENTGASDIQGAKLTVEILRDGTRIAVAQSDPLRVSSGRDVDLDAFYTPNQPGLFTARGYVTYDGIRTLAEESPLTVSPSSATPNVSPSAGTPSIPSVEPQKNNAPGLPIIAIIITVAGLAQWRTRQNK
ncbi:MAG: hypothetical protein WDA16_04930 [Candidatus Thermoplasmatota archaeon]